MWNLMEGPSHSFSLNSIEQTEDKTEGKMSQAKAGQLRQRPGRASPLLMHSGRVYCKGFCNQAMTVTLPHHVAHLKKWDAYKLHKVL